MKSCVIAPSFLFTVGIATRVILMIFAFLGLTGFLGFCISLNHGLHEGHTLIAPKFLLELLRFWWLSHGSAKGFTIFVMAMAVTRVMHLIGAAMGFATLANLSLRAFLETQSLESLDAFVLGLLLVLGWAAVSLPFALSFSLNFSTMTHSIFSRSGSNVQGDLGTVRWVRLYWFYHIIGTDASMIATRSAFLKGTFPFFVIVTAFVLGDQWPTRWPKIHARLGYQKKGGNTMKSQWGAVMAR